MPRSLVAQGCRFDPQFEILEDWDLVLALAPRTRFAFVPRETFEWNADAGDSGAGGGSNEDNARFARYRDLVYAKWRAAHDALVDRVQPKLQQAAAAAQRGDLARAEATCREVLAFSQNDPWRSISSQWSSAPEEGSAKRAPRRSSPSRCGLAIRTSSTISRFCAGKARTSTPRADTRRTRLSLAPGVAKYSALAGALG